MGLCERRYAPRWFWSTTESTEAACRSIVVIGEVFACFSVCGFWKASDACVNCGAFRQDLQDF